jgi:phenylpropionate dioxygenase-like ring-hydroxylating dioxygenase large terminal subunit
MTQTEIWHPADRDVPNVSAIPLEGVPTDDSVACEPIATSRYTSPDFARAEKELLWPRVWQPACREEQIPKAGDFVTFEIGDQSLIVTRQADGGIKAFFNTCRHRGTELVCKASGSVRQFRCPNHAWTYDIDGRLTNVLSPSEFPTKPDYSLQQAQVDTWGGFVFVNLDGKAGPLADYLGPVAGVLAPYHLERMRVRSITRWKMGCNWKVAQEAFMEAYHLPGAHPQLVFTHDEVNAFYDRIGRHSRMQVPVYKASERLGEVDDETILEGFAELLPGFGTVEDVELPDGMSAADFAAQTIREQAARKGIDISELGDEHIRYANSFLIFPNLLLQAYSTEVLVWRSLPDGDDPDSCFFERIMIYAVPEGAEPFTVKQHYIEDWERDRDPGIVLAQDFALMPKIQRGMHQRACTELYAASKQELRVSHMHDEMDRVMGLQNRRGV